MWSSSGTPSRSAITNVANGFEYSPMNSHSPLCRNSSSWRSARRHMNSSFCLSRLGVSSLAQHRSGLGVIRRIHGDHVLVHRERTAVLVDLCADVVAFRCERQRRERPAERDDVRERLRVLVDLDGFFVAGDGDDAVVRQAQHRVLAAQVVEVRVRIWDQRRIGEEVDRVVVCSSDCVSLGWVYRWYSAASGTAATISKSRMC